MKNFKRSKPQCIRCRKFDKRANFYLGDDGPFCASCAERANGIWEIADKYYKENGFQNNQWYHTEGDEPMTKTVSIADFLTGDEIVRAVKLYKESPNSTFAKRACTEIIEPNMERINKALGQDNSPMYLAYMVEYVLSAALKEEKENG